MNTFLNFSPTIQALFATIFTWGVTALGAALVFFINKKNNKLLNIMLGFAGGVMIAASFFSLLSPGIEMSISLGQIPWLMSVSGFLTGCLFLYFSDFIMAKLSKKRKNLISNKRNFLLVFSITLHNIPEGLAIGVAFGSAALMIGDSTIIGACLLALGIGIQNFPEGCAVSIPLYKEGMSKPKAFMYGQLSGFVEPIAGVFGAYLVTQATVLLPFMLAFAAGAMIYVVFDELMPDDNDQDNILKVGKLSTIGAMLGFAVMMLLDVMLG